jgi:hypothetical protein
MRVYELIKLYDDMFVDIHCIRAKSFPSYGWDLKMARGEVSIKVQTTKFMKE